MRTLYKYVTGIFLILATTLLLFHMKKDFITLGYHSKHKSSGIDYHMVIRRYKDAILDTKPQFSSLIQDSESLIARIKERCRAENISTYWNMDLNPLPKPRMLLFRAKEGVLYASNPKTGCTSFRVFMFLLDGVTLWQIKEKGAFKDYEKHYQVINYETVHPGLGYMTCNMLKIGAIRNPLTRLVSAFRDKQLRKQEYMQPGVNYTSDLTEVQIFKLFVDEVLPGGLDKNIHFAPQWDQMEVCRWPYDLLIPFEREHDYIELYQDMTGTARVHFPKSRSNKGLDAHNSTYYAHKFYSQLSEMQMKYIYDLYEMDFKLLGYTKFEDIGFPNLPGI